MTRTPELTITQGRDHHPEAVVAVLHTHPPVPGFISTEGNSAMTMATITRREPRTFVPSQVWDREVQIIMRDHAMDRDLAERTFGQTIAFLVTSADNPEVAMGPTPAVDKGWHSFLLDTRHYSHFCQQYAGRYLHHVPQLTEDNQEPPVLRQTVAAIRAAGFALDTELWNADIVDCNQCHAGCEDSPKGPKK